MRAQVIHLYTGRPVTRMGLERSVVWDDINGDGVVEAVRLSTLPTAGQSSEDQVPFPLHAPPHARRRHSLARMRVLCSGWAQCWALGQSGVPPQEDLFNVSICEPKPQGFLELLTSNPKRKSRGDTYTCPPPTTLPSHHHTRNDVFTGALQWRAARDQSDLHCAPADVG